MKPNLCAAAAFLCILTGCTLGLQEYSISKNACFSLDSSAVLVLETLWKSTKPHDPYYSGIHGRDYITRLYCIEPVPGEGTFNTSSLSPEVQWDDAHGDSFQGWMQSSPLWWYKPQDFLGRLYYTHGGKAVVRNLDTLQREELSLPAENEEFWIRNHLTDVSLDEPIPSVGFYPSPDGTRAAAVYQAGVLRSGFEMDYWTIFALYRVEDRHVLTYTWSAQSESLKYSFRIDPPELKDHSLHPVGSYSPIYGFWEDDSQTFLVLGSETLSAPFEAWLLSVTADDTWEVTKPEGSFAEPYPVGRGGGVSSSGMLLTVQEYPSEPNRAGLAIVKFSPQSP